MSSASISISRSSGAGAAGDAVTVRRVRFTDDPGPTPQENVLRRFVQPREAVAVYEDLALSDLSAQGPSSAPAPGRHARYRFVPQGRFRRVAPRNWRHGSLQTVPKPRRRGHRA